MILHVLSLPLQLQPEIIHLQFSFLWAFRADLMLRTSLLPYLEHVRRQRLADSMMVLAGSTAWSSEWQLEPKWLRKGLNPSEKYESQLG